MNPPIPNRLKEIRMRHKLRQIDIAAKLGHTSGERISKWEKGISFPHIPNLFKMCSYLGVKPDEIYPELLYGSYRGGLFGAHPSSPASSACILPEAERSLLVLS